MSPRVISIRKEEAGVDRFAQNIDKAGEVFWANPMQPLFIPGWKRLMRAVPGFREVFLKRSKKTTA